MKVPLARALSKLGIMSRTEAIERVLAGEVRVGGRIVRDPGHPVVPETARISVAVQRSRGRRRLRWARETQVRVELTEGRNRELRRMFAACGHEVTRLKRVAFGRLELGDLAPGEWRIVAPEELARAFPRAPIRRTPTSQIPNPQRT